MRIIITIALLTVYFTSQAQLEKVGLYTGTSFTVQNYARYDNGIGKGKGFFAPSHRIGLMSSFYGNERFSYETGLLLDFTSIKNRRDLKFQYDDGLKVHVHTHEHTNIGIPLSATMRTNVTRNCVTYFKFSLINLFTIHEFQSLSNENIPESTNHIAHQVNSAISQFRYYSTDIDFGFGTFWYLKRFGAKFCLEPNITVFQFRNAMYVADLPDRKIVDNHFKILARLGFEITLYKDLF